MGLGYGFTQDPNDDICIIGKLKLSCDHSVKVSDRLARRISRRI